MRRQSTGDSDVEAIMSVISDMWEEGKGALLDEQNMAVALVGGILTFLAGVAAAPFGWGLPVLLTGSTSTLLAYFGKAFLDFAYVTPGEKVMRKERRTLRNADHELALLDRQLARLYEDYQFRYHPLYTREEFDLRRTQLREVFHSARAINAVLQGDKFSQSAWESIMPEIRNLVRIAVVLYQRRLFLLGQLFAIGVGEDQKIKDLQNEVTRLKSEAQQRGIDDELRARRIEAQKAAEGRLEAYQEGLGNPSLLLGKIDLIEADIDMVRGTLGRWYERLRAQAAQVTQLGYSTSEAGQVREELVATVQSLHFTEESQNEMKEMLKDVKNGLTSMEDL